MSSRVETASDRALLRPSIWIRCGSKRCRDEIRRAVTDLSYLRAFHIHFRLDAPRFACYSTRCPAGVIRRATETPRPSGGPHWSAEAIVGLAVSIGVVTLVIMYFVILFWRKWSEKILPNRVPVTRNPILSEPSLQAKRIPVKSQTSPSLIYPNEASGDGYSTREKTQEFWRSKRLTCGLKVEFKVGDGNAIFVAKSTIGRSVQLNGVTYGLTTTHSIIEVMSNYDGAQNQKSHAVLKVRVGKFDFQSTMSKIHRC